MVGRGVVVVLRVFLRFNWDYGRGLLLACVIVGR